MIKAPWNYAEKFALDKRGYRGNVRAGVHPHISRDTPPLACGCGQASEQVCIRTSHATQFIRHHRPPFVRAGVHPHISRDARPRLVGLDLGQSRCASAHLTRLAAAFLRSSVGQSRCASAHLTRRRVVGHHPRQSQSRCASAHLTRRALEVSLAGLASDQVCIRTSHATFPCCIMAFTAESDQVCIRTSHATSAASPMMLSPASEQVYFRTSHARRRPSPPPNHLPTIIGWLGGGEGRRDAPQRKEHAPHISRRRVIRA